MVAGYLKLTSQSMELDVSNYALDNLQSVYGRTNNQSVVSSNSSESVIIINDASDPNISSYDIILPTTQAGTMVTIMNKLASININLISSANVPITNLNGLDLCKLITYGGDAWFTMFNQTSQAQLPIGYMFGKVRVVDRASKAAGPMRMSSGNSEIARVGLTYSINDSSGTLTINNPNISFNGVLQLDFMPVMFGFSNTNNNQHFNYQIVVNPPSLSSQVITSDFLNSYGYTACSMLALIDMTRITSVSIQIVGSEFTGPVSMEWSDLIITSLPQVLTNVQPTIPINYSPLVPQMTSNTTPAPYKIFASSEQTPGWWAFNSLQSGWINATSDPADQPDISVSFGTRVTAAYITLTTLPLTPDNMNMNVYISGSYIENGANYLQTITQIDYMVGNADGTSKTYQIFPTSDIAYETYIFQITFYSSDNNSKAGFKNIQLYSTTQYTGDGGTSNFSSLPYFDGTDDNGKPIVSSSISLPDVDNRNKFYYNSLAANQFNYNYSGTLEVNNIYSDKIKYLGYNGPDTLHNIGMYDYSMIIANYPLIYRSVTSYDYVTWFRAGLQSTTNPLFIKGEVMKFFLGPNSSSTEMSITLTQNGEIMNFKNNTSSAISVGLYLPICFAQNAPGQVPSITYYVELSPYPFKAGCATWNDSTGSPAVETTTSMITNLYETITVPANTNIRMQVYNENPLPPSPSGDAKLINTDYQTYSLGVITVY